ncbi:Hpt domain-containing protein [Butyrivibrio sp.]|uniref:Hpt domain-containing protein n=1 Tax=Butyrivibrio sp. TaxID=28121 RepID=UPI001B76E084|nr:Hpt domain-containing protein [Butyrivibrio sp.]MBP3818946.1 Hpt domain-containing protein [Butyrivibrio sp.]MBQ9304776.1 Hpt domain-containing protein [Butyrivibrio sp.]
MNIEKLRELGANVDEGLERCMGMEDFYLEMIELGLSDDRFEALGKALEEGNLDRAFEDAHALKGVVGNLALTPLYETVSEITENLRTKVQTDYEVIYKKILSQREAFLQ